MWQTGFRSLPQCVMSAVLRTAVWQPSFESAWIIWDGLSETSSFRIHRFCFTMSLVIGVASSAAFEKSATASAFNLFTAISGIWQRPTIAAISSAVSFFSIDPDGLPIPLSICKINAWELKKDHLVICAVADNDTGTWNKWKCYAGMRAKSIQHPFPHLERLAKAWHVCAPWSPCTHAVYEKHLCSLNILLQWFLALKCNESPAPSNGAKIIMQSSCKKKHQILWVKLKWNRLDHFWIPIQNDPALRYS